jgi:hypothetical protein
MRQAEVRDYYGAELLYNVFEYLNFVKLKNSKLKSCRSHRDLQCLCKNHFHPTSYQRVMIFQKFGLHAIPGGATRQYYHANRSGVISFSTFKTPSNMSYLAAPMHMARLCYLVVSTGLTRPKRLSGAKYFFGTVDIKIFIKNGLKYKRPPVATCHDPQSSFILCFSTVVNYKLTLWDFA